jgi:hypothetical protein
MFNETPERKYMERKELYNKKYREISTAKIIDRSNYEANKMGCIIQDYDKFNKSRNEEILLLIGVLGIYTLFGMILGAIIMLQYLKIV